MKKRIQVDTQAAGERLEGGPRSAGLGKVEDMKILLIFVAAGFMAVVFTLARNALVYKYRVAMLRALQTRLRQPDFDAVFTEFTSVSYYAMLFHFWRRLDSFYHGTQILSLVQSLRRHGSEQEAS